MSDWQEFKESKKEIAAERMKVFYDLILPQIEEEYKVVFKPSNAMYTLTKTNYGPIDVWPTTDKLFIRNQKKVITNAKQWLIKKLKLED